jgi:dihydrofolate reductase
MRAIVAMAGNRVIGNGAKIPWHIPADFKWFKKTTMGGKLLMGRKTFESIGKPLPGRYTFVLSNADDVWQRSATESFMYIGESFIDDLSQATQDEFWVCGGATVYEKFLPKCREIYVSHVIGDFEGDVFMPPFEVDFPVQSVIMEHKDFWVVKHSR